jgi:hypothetical protein
MLRIQIIGLALVSAFVMSAVAAGSASAETVLRLQWLLVHHLSGGGLVHLLLSAPLPVRALGLLLLADTKPPIGGEVKIHCHGFELGTVGPHGLDLVRLIADLSGTNHKVTCSFDKAGGCNGSQPVTAEALHLPWLTHLALFNSGAEIRDIILSDGAGTPGWRVLCTNVLGGPSEDVCEEEGGNAASTQMTNLETGVLGDFKGSAKAHCSMGGAGAGVVEGTVLTENPSPTLTLEISPLD